jgi:hypothetical protein
MYLTNPRPHGVGAKGTGSTGGPTAHGTKTIVFSLVPGAFHHISAKHMQRYLEEFDFRWNRRRMTDSDRLLEAVAGTESARLYYRLPASLLPRSQE